MARPQSVSESEILDAANRVISRVGPDAFTLAAVAREVGLTRAAITFRFECARGLKLKALEKRAEAFTEMLEGLYIEPGGNGLLKLAGFIGSLPKNAANLISYLSVSNSNLDDEDLMAIEKRRGAALRATIVRAIPDSVTDKHALAAVFSAHLTGSLVAWASSGEDDGQSYLLKRTSMLLDMIGISYDASQYGVCEPA